jgi:hypothetical protein
MMSCSVSLTAYVIFALFGTVVAVFLGIVARQESKRLEAESDSEDEPPEDPPDPSPTGVKLRAGFTGRMARR